MKRNFDLVSHFFALMPLVILIRNIMNSQKVIRDLVLAVFLTSAVGTSIWYHSFESTGVGYVDAQSVDHFFSASLVAITFLLYVDHYYWPTILSVIVIGILVWFEHESKNNMPRYMFLALIIVVSIYLFYRERKKNTKERRFNMKDPFFFSFFFTQLLAVLFFLWDEPYMHSLWHLFAFVSLGSVIVHSGNTETDEIEKLIFYCLSSLPSRFFISWIFMDWESGDGGLVGTVFLLLSLSMGWGFYKKRRLYLCKGCLSYLVISILLYAKLMYGAGCVFVGDTFVSACIYAMT